MSELEDAIRDGGKVILGGNANTAKTVAASQGSKRIVENAQVRSSEDLHKFVERYEVDQKEQAKENRVNRWLTVASLLIALSLWSRPSSRLSDEIPDDSDDQSDEGDKLHTNRSNQNLGCRPGSPVALTAGLFVVVHVVHLLVCTSFLR